VLQLDGDLGDGVEDPVAVAALLEVVVEIPVHQLPEGLGCHLLYFLAADDGVRPAGRRDVDQDGGGSLALGEPPLLEQCAGAGLRIFGRPLVNGEPDPRPGVSPRLVEWSTDAPAPTKYWLVDLRGKRLGVGRFIRLAKGRWRIEQDYRELKDELGLDHFEGRSYLGWHHHVTLVSMAYAFLTLERLRAKKNLAVDLAPDPAAPPADVAVAG